MSKNWVIVSGTILEIENVNVLKKCDKEYVGDYIKTHVKELFNHFIVLSQCDESGGSIWKFIRKYREDYKYDLTDLSNEEFIKVIEDITKELEKYDNQELVNQFSACSEDNDGYFVRVNKLSKLEYLNYE